MGLFDRLRGRRSVDQVQAAYELVLLACTWEYEASTLSLIAEHIAVDVDDVLSELLTLRLAAIHLMIERRVTDVGKKRRIVDTYYGLLMALYGLSIDPPSLLVSPKLTKADVDGFRKAIDRDLKDGNEGKALADNMYHLAPPETIHRRIQAYLESITSGRSPDRLAAIPGDDLPKDAKSLIALRLLWPNEFRVYLTLAGTYFDSTGIS